LTLDSWSPAQYARFRDERSQPFYDLAAMVEHRPGMRIVDLGCGTGALTAWLHRELAADETLGIDVSDSMLAEAAGQHAAGLRFERREILEFAERREGGGFDLVFSNAALQWVDHHETLFAALARLLAPAGQLAVQMPANDDHVSHATARAVAREEPFASALEGYVRPDPVRAPEWYAEMLHGLGFGEQRVLLRVYPHVLSETRAVVEWVKGTYLTPYAARLPAELYASFIARYEERLLAALGESRPYFYSFKRVLIWAQR
jgi:trans-aconitate 2-methyltransferase